MDNNSGQREPGSSVDHLLLGAGAAVFAVGLATWLGARLAVALTGGRLAGGIDVWLTAAARLARGRSPNDAWGASASGLPDPWLYWACTVAAAVVVGAV